MKINVPDKDMYVEHQMDKGAVTKYHLGSVPTDVAMEWSNIKTPPAILSKVKVNMNSMGPGKVVGYFIEYGWLGVYVKLGLKTRPDYQKRQNPKNEPVMVFGIEIDY